MGKQPDRWAAWLLEHRDGGDARVLERLAPELHRFRDTVLDNASIADGDVVLDVGTGTGLIGFGALEREASAGGVRVQGTAGGCWPGRSAAPWR